MVMLIVLPSLIITATFFVFWYLTRNFNYWKKRNIIGPDPVPLFGNLKESALRREHQSVILHKIYDEYPNEKFVGIYRMTTPSLLIRDLDALKNILIKDFDKFEDRGTEFSEKGLGCNLFHSYGHTWRALRTQLNPIFTTSKLKNMFPLLLERAEKFIEHYEKKLSIESVQDIQKIAKSFTISGISACAFGIDMDPTDPKKKAIDRLDNLIFSTTYAVEFDMMFPGMLKKLNMSLFPSEVNNFFTDLVKTVSNQRNGKPSSRHDFMDLLMEMKRQKVMHHSKGVSQMEVELTDDILAAQAFVFYAAGYETSSTTTSFLLYELSQNPHIQDKLIAEIDDVLKRNDGKLTFDTLMSMPYLGMVIDETLRMHPVVDTLQRKANEDYKVPGTEVTIEKGCIVVVSLDGIHSDERLYRNPREFDPERFSAENRKQRHQCAYMPFGLGPRHCIGMRFGLMQTRVFLVTFLSRFRVEATADIKQLLAKPNPKRVVVGPESGVPLKLIPRWT